MFKGKKLLLLDGFSLLHRAFYALPPLKNSKGIQINALYGLSNMLFKVIQDFNPDYLITALDLKGGTHRHDQFEGYKAQRKAMPDELAEQLPFLPALLEGFGITTASMEHYEADDVIGSLSKKAVKEGMDVFIITGDRDAYQLIEDHITVVMTKKGLSETVLYTPAEIMEEYQVNPLQMIELKALMGDASDNIPGVKGVGEKTAISLITRFGSVENLYDNLEEITQKKLKEKLTEGKENAFMSKSLATIVTDLPFNDDMFQPYQGIQSEKLKAFFTEIESNTLLKKVLTQEEKKDQKIKDDPESSQTVEETADLPLTKGSYGVLKQGEEVAVVNEEGQVCRLTKDRVRELFENESIHKYVYDLKSWLHYLRKEQIEANGTVDDIMLMGYLLDPSMNMNYPDLIFKTTSDFLNNADILTSVKPLLKAYGILKERLASANQTKLYETMELPLASILFEMEWAGVRVDREELKLLTAQYETEMRRLEQEIYEAAGMTFNINSPKQLSHVLFEKMMLPALKKTKTGYSTDTEVLTELAKSYPIAGLIQEYRSYTKLYSTYCVGIEKLLTEDSRIHTTFQQTVTTTGRLSSTDPNMQNIPAKTELGRELRKIFVPTNPEGYLLAADYSQIELRILAHVTRDPVLTDAFLKNEDIHSITASQVFHIPLSEVTKEMRYRAKAVNFGIVYGISSFGLSNNLKISPKEAQSYIDGYFHTYEGVKTYIDDVIQETKKDGFVTTIFNRRRYIPDITHTNFQKRSFAERAAVNATIQGSAADMMKLAMIAIDRKMKEKKMHSKMILQVHDELIFDVEPEEVLLLESLVKETMEHTVELSVPLTVDAGYGANWFEAK